MSARIFIAVMHCAIKQPVKVIERGIKVRDGLYVNTTLYTAPPMSKSDFIKLLNAADTAQGDVKGGGKQATNKRDTAVKALFDELEKLQLYVNSLYKGDKDKLAKSGFDTSEEPAPHDIPDAPVIRKIKDASVSHSAKIFLAKTTSPLNTKRESVIYTVQMAESENEADFKTVLQTKNQRKLIITGLTRGKEEFFRVAKTNAKGQSDWSDPVSFIPQ